MMPFDLVLGKMYVIELKNDYGIIEEVRNIKLYEIKENAISALIDELIIYYTLNKDKK